MVLQPNENECVVILLETVWAKVNVGFSLIIRGDISSVAINVIVFPFVSYYNDELLNRELKQNMLILYRK